MEKDCGVYILVSPTEKKSSEYRVAYLDSGNNINWTIDTDTPPRTLTPSKVKPYFDSVTVYTNILEAQDEADRISTELKIGPDAPTFRVYIDTPYPVWSDTTYA